MKGGMIGGEWGRLGNVGGEGGRNVHCGSGHCVFLQSCGKGFISKMY